jgi:hypothetical protein
MLISASWPPEAHAQGPLRTPSAEEQEAIRRYWQLTSLKEGEILKRIATPFPEYRAVAVRAMGSAQVPDVKYTRFRPGDTRYGGGAHAGPASLPRLAAGLLEIEPADIQGDAELLKAPFDGDWVVREGTPVEQVLPGLAEILRTQCDLPIKLRLDQVEREVFVAQGKFAAADRPSIDVYGKQIAARRGGGGSGGFNHFLQAVGQHISARIVSEAEVPQGLQLRWRFNSPVRMPPQQRTEDRDPDGVLRHVAAQTGLTFQKANRKVRTLVVERAE